MSAADLWAKIEKVNHFEALGLHWSTPPRKIKPTFEEMERLYGPTGEARSADPATCDLIWARARQAYAVLDDAKKRKAHRLDAYQLQWSQQIELMLDRADISIYRRDFEDAYDLLMVCQDIKPTRKAAELLLKLKDKSGADGKDPDVKDDTVKQR